MPKKRRNSKKRTNGTNGTKGTKGKNKQSTSVESSSSSSSLSVEKVHSPIEEPMGVGVVDEDWELTPKHFDTSQASSLPEPEPEPEPEPRRRQLLDPLNITFSGAGPPDSFYEETRGFAQRWRPLNPEDNPELKRLLYDSHSSSSDFSSSHSSSSDSSSSDSSSVHHSDSTISPEEVEERKRQKRQTRRQKRRRPRKTRKSRK
jgi:hypothetical protein